MKEFLTRSLLDLIGRMDGPLAFRLILQPVAAAFLAIRAGLKDVRMGTPRMDGSFSAIRFATTTFYSRGSKEIPESSSSPSSSI